MRRFGWVAVSLAMVACGGAPSPGTGQNDAGTTTDAGSSDAGASDAGLPTADDCTGIVPTVPSALTFEIPAAAGDTCGAAVANDAGTIAAESHTGAVTNDATQLNWHEFDALGGPTGTFKAGTLVPQASGFLALQGNTPASLNLESWDASGRVNNLAPIGDGSAGVAIAAGFPDGAVVLHNAGGTLVAQSFDTNGNPVNVVPVTTSAAVLAAAQDQSGPVLAVLSGGQGIWVDLVAGTSGAPFPLGNGSAAIARALNGGGVAVRLDGHWTAVVHPPSPTLAAPPPWLTVGSDFVVARGGKAYAVTTPASSSISLAVGQTTCGAITLQGVFSVSVGSEGTVIGSSNTSASGCSKIFWSKLLQ
jgi:hypothetical protein